MIKNRVIDWEGHRARLELSHDDDSTEYKIAKKKPGAVGNPEDDSGRFCPAGCP